MLNSEPVNNSGKIPEELTSLSELFFRISEGDFPDAGDYAFAKDSVCAPVYTNLKKMMETLCGTIADNNKKKTEMETLVKQRTEQLALLNIQLSKDIAEQHIMEDALRESEEQYRLLAESAHDIIFIVDRSLSIRYINEFGANALKMAQLDVAGKNINTLFLSEISSLFEHAIQAVLSTGQPISVEGICRFPSREAWLETKLIPIRSKNGYVDTLLGIARDITERKKIDDALSAEKDRLDVTLSSIVDSVISTDAEGKVVTINKMAETLTGFSKLEAMGRPIDNICKVIDDKTNMPHEGIFARMIDKHGLVPHKTVCTILSRDNSSHVVDLSVAPIRTKEGGAIGIVMVFRDISEKQKLEAELFKARKLDSLGVLAGGIAHDFNNILTGIITNLFMAKLSLPTDGECYKMLIDAEKACFRASRLTKQLLTFSKGGAPVKEICSIKELIEETVGFCLSGSNAGYRLDLPDDLMAASVDKGQIDQVLNNLLINAQQAMPLGGTIIVNAENVALFSGCGLDQRLLSLPAGNYIKVSIQDEGMGIGEVDLEKIFDPYFTTKPSGNGLGLTTSYSIIKNHGGLIVVDSKLGTGSSFSFYLPAMDLSFEEPLDDCDDIPTGRGKILVMDDDDSVRNVILRLLTGYGYNALCTSSGDETIATYKNAHITGEPFDAVIMDLTIPGGMGGKEVVKILKGFDPHVKAIVSSGYSNDPIMANFREFGFKGVIVKPFNIDDFVRIIESVIREDFEAN